MQLRTPRDRGVAPLAGGLYGKRGGARARRGRFPSDAAGPRGTTAPPPPGDPAVYVWQPGHWQWDGHAYDWHPGHYEKRPARSAHWVPAEWIERNGHWEFHRGHWTCH
jgi:hypothetical protein